MTKTKAVFETVQDQILGDLLAGVYQAGDPVPDRENLRRAFRTNTETIDRAIQGLEMNRPSELVASYQGEPGKEKITVGGRACLVVEGVLHV